MATMLNEKKPGASSRIDYVEMLAHLFEDDQTSDAGTMNGLQNRLITILDKSTAPGKTDVTHFGALLSKTGSCTLK